MLYVDLQVVQLIA